MAKKKEATITAETIVKQYEKDQPEVQDDEYVEGAEE